MELKKVEKLEKSIVALTIEIAADELDKAKNQAYKKNGKSIQVPGFRKGKAPRHLIEKLYGDVFFEDALNIVYPDAMDKCVAESGIKPVGMADVELGEDAPEGGVVIIAKVPVEPEVTLGEYKGLTAEKASVSVPAKEVKEELERMAKRMSRVETVERAAKKDDTVTIDFEGFVDGAAFEGGKGENYDLVLGSGSFIPGFEDQLIGCKAGDEKDVEVTFPEEYHAEELKGKPAVFKCKVHTVKQTVLPELDDEFAKDVSETAETMDDLKKEVSDRLLKGKTDAAEREFEEKLLDQVLEGMQAEIPEAMYESQTDSIVNDFSYRIQMQGVTLEQYLGMNGMDMASFRKVFREQAERQVKVRLALQKIAELESIEIGDEAVEAEYTKMAEQYGMEADQVKKAVSADAIRDDLKLNRAIEVIKENAKVKKATRKKKAETAEEPAAETEAE